MTSVQLHLALTHVPVILSITGLLMLIVSFFIKNNVLLKISYTLLVVSAIAALPVYFTGEGAEEVVEHLPGVSEPLIEEHEEVAKMGLISIIVAGILALAAFFANRWKNVSKILNVAVLAAALVTGGLMARTAHLGGQIRHSEIRDGNLAQADENSQEDGDGE